MAPLRSQNSLFALSRQEVFLSPSERAGIGILDFTKIKHLLITNQKFWFALGIFFVTLCFIRGGRTDQSPFYGLLLMTSSSLLCLKNILSYESVKSAHFKPFIATILFILGLRVTLEHLSFGIILFAIMIMTSFFIIYRLKAL